MWEKGVSKHCTGRACWGLLLGNNKNRSSREEHTCSDPLGILTQMEFWSTETRSRGMSMWSSVHMDIPMALICCDAWYGHGSGFIVHCDMDMVLFHYEGMVQDLRPLLSLQLPESFHLKHIHWVLLITWHNMIFPFQRLKERDKLCMTICVDKVDVETSMCSCHRILGPWVWEHSGFTKGLGNW